MIGDIVGRLGRKVVTELLPDFRKKNDIDWVIANGENMAGGIGVTKSTMTEMLNSGIDIVTSGNHVFRKDEASEILKKNDSVLIRPENYPKGTVGRGWKLFENALGQKIVVINIIGCVGFRECFDNPFQAVDRILNEEFKKEGIMTDKIDGIFVDFHAETTSEKIAMLYHLDGRVTAVCGTHTHVTTADEKVLPGGTAVICDLGMTGSTESVLGLNKEVVIKQFITQLPEKFMWKTTGAGKMSGVVIKTKKGSNKAISIKRISLNLDN